MDSQQGPVNGHFRSTDYKMRLNQTTGKDIRESGHIFLLKRVYHCKKTKTVIQIIFHSKYYNENFQD